MKQGLPGTREGGRGLVFSGLAVLVLKDERVLEMDGREGV